MRSRTSKIHAPAALARRLAADRRAGRRIVFTNGCFDLLHRGHVDYLERARRLGDRLVVALNSDASLRKLKGPGRPLTPLRDRQEILAALECVDYVTSFGTDTPLILIRRLRPDRLVKGGDYRPDDIVGAADVRATGGRVLVLPLVKGRSTTGILARAKRGLPLD